MENENLNLSPVIEEDTISDIISDIEESPLQQASRIEEATPSSAQHTPPSAQIFHETLLADESNDAMRVSNRTFIDVPRDAQKLTQEPINRESTLCDGSPPLGAVKRDHQVVHDASSRSIMSSLRSESEENGWTAKPLLSVSNSSCSANQVSTKDESAVGEKSSGYYVTVEKHFDAEEKAQGPDSPSSDKSKNDSAQSDTSSRSLSWQSSFDFPVKTVELQADIEQLKVEHNYPQRYRTVEQGSSDVKVHQYARSTGTLLATDVQIIKSDGSRQQAMKNITSKLGPRKPVKLSVPVVHVQNKSDDAASIQQDQVKSFTGINLPPEIKVQHELVQSDFITQLLTRFLSNNQPQTSIQQHDTDITNIPTTARKTPLVQPTRLDGRFDAVEVALKTPAPRCRLPKASPYEGNLLSDVTNQQKQITPDIADSQGGFMSHIVDTYPSPLSPLKSPRIAQSEHSNQRSDVVTNQSTHKPPTKRSQSPKRRSTSSRQSPLRYYPRSPNKRVHSPSVLDREPMPVREIEPSSMRDRLAVSPLRTVKDVHVISPVDRVRRSSSPNRLSPSRKRSPVKSRSPSPRSVERRTKSLMDKIRDDQEKIFNQQLEELRVEMRRQRAADKVDEVLQTHTHKTDNKLSPLDSYLRELDKTAAKTRPIFDAMTGTDLNQTFSVTDNSKPTNFLTRMAMRLRELESRAKLFDENTATLLSMREKSKSQAYSSANGFDAESEEKIKLQKLVDKSVNKAIQDVQTLVSEVDFQPKPRRSTQEKAIPTRYKTAAQRLQTINSKVDTGLPKTTNINKENIRTGLQKRTTPEVIRDEKYMRQVYGNAFYNSQRRTNRLTNQPQAVPPPANRKPPSEPTNQQYSNKLPFKTVQVKHVASKKTQSSPQVEQRAAELINQEEDYEDIPYYTRPRVILGPGLIMANEDDEPTKVVMETIDTLPKTTSRPQEQAIIQEMAEAGEFNVNNNAASDTSPREQEERGDKATSSNPHKAESNVSPIAQVSTSDTLDGASQVSQASRSHVHSTPLETVGAEKQTKPAEAADKQEPEVDWSDYAVSGDNPSNESEDRSRTDDIVTPPLGIHGAFRGRKKPDGEPRPLFSDTPTTLPQILSSDGRVSLPIQQETNQGPPDPTQLATADWVEQQVMARVVRRMHDQKRQFEERVFTGQANQAEWMEKAEHEANRLGLDLDEYTPEERDHIKSVFKDCLKEKIKEVLSNYQPQQPTYQESVTKTIPKQHVSTPEPTPPTTPRDEPIKRDDPLETPPFSPRSQKSEDDVADYKPDVISFNQPHPDHSLYPSPKKPDIDVGVQTIETAPPDSQPVQSAVDLPQSVQPEQLNHSANKLHLSQVSLWDTLSAGNSQLIGTARDTDSDIFEMRYSIDTPEHTPQTQSPITEPVSEPFSQLSNQNTTDIDQPITDRPVVETEDISVQADLSHPEQPEQPEADSVISSEPTSKLDTDTSSVSETAGHTVSAGEWILKSEGQISPHRLEQKDKTGEDLDTLDEISTSSEQTVSQSDSDKSFSTGQIKRGGEDLNLSDLRKRLAEQRKKLTASSSPSPTYRIKHDQRETHKHRLILVTADEQGQVNRVNSNEVQTYKEHESELVKFSTHTTQQEYDEIPIQPSPTVETQVFRKSVERKSPGASLGRSNKKSPGGVSLGQYLPQRKTPNRNRVSRESLDSTDKLNTESIIKQLTLDYSGEVATDQLLDRSIDEQGLSTAPSYIDTNKLLADTIREETEYLTVQSSNQSQHESQRPIESRLSPQPSVRTSTTRFTTDTRTSREGLNTSFNRSILDSTDYANYTGSPVGILRNSYESGGATPRTSERKQLRVSLVLPSEDISDDSLSTEYLSKTSNTRLSSDF